MSKAKSCFSFCFGKMFIINLWELGRLKESFSFYSEIMFVPQTFFVRKMQQITDTSFVFAINILFRVPNHRISESTLQIYIHFL